MEVTIKKTTILTLFKHNEKTLEIKQVATLYDIIYYFNKENGNIYYVRGKSINNLINNPNIIKKGQFNGIDESLSIKIGNTNIK